MEQEVKTFETSVALRIVYAVLFLISLWVAFPPYSGRHATTLMLPFMLPIYWYFLFFTAHRVEIYKSGTLLCRSILRRKTLYATDISEIHDGLMVIKIITNKGAIRITNLINNPESLTTELQKLNPDIITNGYNK
ncbi:hypothetical protein Geob_0986 [Geotalea daltonii FRC-32]|uniref:Uncharacterized protein n=1 Tax=Geotalea daltonii (strain DSM 22248 / JCM 15807 / FRC-32) TaxID=316067 RepID=B9M2G9_GEODF|nr:hypothetical protein [Geotalea daltonii]ACM19348.1 hypothetical protein Geob_0986 [Geotalea daltonii FRC-32]